MPSSTVITDRELQQRSECSFYNPTEIDPYEGPSRLTIRWALRERANGIICSYQDLGERWSAEWQKIWGNNTNNQDYWNGERKALSFARRVYEFLLDYEVRHSYEPYTLQLDRGQVKGENALAVWRKYRKGHVPMLIDPLLRSPRYVKTPNYAVLAQWLAAREDDEAVELGIVHLPMIRGERWLTKDVNEQLVRQWINSLVNEAADNGGVPRKGLQCAKCSQPCKEVFTGPEGKDWDKL